MWMYRMAMLLLILREGFMKKLILIALLLFFIFPVDGYSRTAASCGQSDVQTAITAASDGETINIPPGNCDWTTGVTINNKEVYLVGAGVGSTNISWASTSGSNAFKVINNTKSFSISNMSVVSTNGGTTFNIYRTSNQTNVSENWSVFNMNIQMTANKGGIVFWIRGYQNGVVHSNTIRRHNNGTTCGFPATNLFLVQGEEGETGSGIDNLWGSNSWRRAVGHGTAGKVYVENNTMEIADGCYGNQAEGGNGGRYVYRYNTITQHASSGPPLECHGACTSGFRGFFGGEFYNNDITMATGAGNPHIKMRGGTWMIHNNKFRGGGTSGYLMVDSQRSSSGSCTQPLNYRCNGDASFDGNTDPKATYMGWPCLDQIGRGTGDSGEQISSPVYAWDNISVRTGGAANAIILNTALGGTNPAQSDHLKKDRDWYESEPDEYTPYTCPHPIAGSGSCATSGATMYGTEGYSLTGGVTDTTPPTVTSFYIYSGTTVINFSELITATSGAAFTVAGLDSAMTLTCPAVSTAASSMTCTNSRTVYQAEGNGTYGYTGTKVIDAAENQLATIDSSPTAVNLSTEVEAPPAVTLTVNKTGTGCTITSSPSGIIAGTTTTADYDTGTVVTLGGYVENGWNSTIVYGGDCASNGTVTMSGAKTCTATCKEKKVLNWSR